MALLCDLTFTPAHGDYSVPATDIQKPASTVQVVEQLHHPSHIYVWEDIPAARRAYMYALFDPDTQQCTLTPKLKRTLYSPKYMHLFSKNYFNQKEIGA